MLGGSHARAASWISFEATAKPVTTHKAPPALRPGRGQRHRRCAAVQVAPAGREPDGSSALHAAPSEPLVPKVRYASCEPPPIGPSSARSLGFFLLGAGAPRDAPRHRLGPASRVFR